jgi:anti-sigma B factor antagonist
MNISFIVADNILHAKLEGDLIGENEGALIVEKASSFIDKGVVRTVVDIADVKYINSAGIGVLITLLTKFRNKGGELVLLNPSQHVQKLLIITKLNSIFQIAESKELAIELLN